MASSDYYYINILQNTFVYTNLYVIPILYIIGNIGNLLSALIFFKKAWRKNVCVFYFLVGLLFNSCYINSTMFSLIFTNGLNVNLQNSNIILCKLLYYTVYLFSALLPTILILASIDRLLISSQNFDTRLYSSKRLAYFSISISTSFWILFFIHTLIKIDIYTILPSITICYLDTIGFYFEFNYYSNVFINVMLSVILIILSVLTFKNVRQIQCVPRQQRQQFRIMNKKDFQLLRCLYIHDIIYTIFVTFPSGYSVYIAVTKNETQPPLQAAIKEFLRKFSIFIHHIPYCASFFIFIIVSKTFRLEIIRLMNKIFGKDLMTIRREENRQQHDGNDILKLNIVKTAVVST